MNSSLDPDLIQAYRDTDYIVSDDPPLLLRIGEQNDGARILMANFDVESGAFITAWNPGSQQLSEDENIDRQMALLSSIEALRLNYLVGSGERDGWREYSYFVLGASMDTATELAQEYEQNAFVFVGPSGTPELITLK